MEHLSQKRKISIMIAIIAAMFFSSINQTIVGVALPRIIAKLGGMEYYTWIITIYLLTSTISTILVGKLSDIYGRKYFILSGIVIFMAGAFLSGTSKDIIQLIIYRGVQGAGAGIIMATAYTAIGDLFSPRERGRWSGLMSAVFGMSSVLGPGVGGYIVEHLEWHWVFWLFLPLGIMAFFMILILFPKVERQASQSIDYLGSVLLTLTIVPMLLAFSWAGTKYSWASSAILGLFGLTLGALVLFILAETKAKTPVLPLSLFKESVVSISNVIGFIMNGGMMGALTYMPFYIQGVMGISPTYAGYVTMPMSISMFAVSAYAGRRMTKTGKYKNMALLGLSIMVAGMLLMVLMTYAKSLPLAIISMVVFGFGLGLGMPVFMLAVQNVVHPKDLGVATASVQLFRNLGSTIGIAVMGTVLSTSIAGRMGGLAAGNGAIKDPAAMQKLSQYLNPQLLLDHSKLEAIQSSLPAAVQPIFLQLMENLKQALTGALSNVFIMGASLMAVALLLTFLLKELPLRTTMAKTKEEPEQRGHGVENHREAAPVMTLELEP
jgi:EmrB/QacA subfamily drug resistance transporter